MRHLAAFVIILALGGCAADMTGPTDTPPGGIPADSRAALPAPGGGARTPVLRPHAPAEPGALRRLYTVVLVPEGETLPVHSAPNATAPVVGTLAPHAPVQSTGQVVILGEVTWIEVQTDAGANSWVDAAYLTEYVSTRRFCEDRGVYDLLADLQIALEEADAERLFDLVSPLHGLRVRYLREGSVVHLAGAEAREALASDAALAWGDHPGSGEPVWASLGSVTSDLATALAAADNYACDAVVLGDASYTATLPADWRGVHHLSLHVPASTEGGLDWVTWDVGVEYVEGQPYLFSLARFAWES